MTCAHGTQIVAVQANTQRPDTRPSTFFIVNMVLNINVTPTVNKYSFLIKIQDYLCHLLLLHRLLHYLTSKYLRQYMYKNFVLCLLIGLWQIKFLCH